MTRRKKIVLGVLIAGLALMIWRAETVGENAHQLHAGDVFPSTTLKNIHDVDVIIPSQTKLVHLQFRRFAGCPICNLHLHSFVERNAEIEAAGVHEVVIFHSPNSSLLPFQGKFPFDVIGDPEKKLYRQFGVESSVFAILNPSVWPSIYKGINLKDKPQGDPEGGPLGLPADLLINANGKVVAAHYGKHAYDQWSVDEVLALVKK